MVDTWKNKGLGPADIAEGDARAFANGKGRELYAAYQQRLTTRVEEHRRCIRLIAIHN